MELSFPKEERLKNKILIGKLFSEGSAVSKYPLRLIYLKIEKNSAPKLKVGVSVSKRSFKKAVDRNRIKRLIREVYRLNKQLFYNTVKKDGFALMFLYTGKELPRFDELNENLKKLHQKFDKNIQE